MKARNADKVLAWRFGSGLTLIALSGELSVDYARRVAWRRNRRT